MSSSTVDTASRSRSSSSVPSTPSSTTTDATDNTPIIRAFLPPLPSLPLSLSPPPLPSLSTNLRTAPAAPLDSNAAPNKAEFLAIQSGLKRRPGPPPGSSASLHTSTYSVATTATAGEGTDDGSEDGSVSVDSHRTPASPSNPQRSGLRRQLYGLQGPGSPEGSTFALPYGTSRNGSVETFATVNSDDVRRGGYSNAGDEPDFDMLEDPRS
ncbi:hypothetical protein PENSPDRAFT_682775 [Peniophora sp. CONT]|nr:hypothetical protein PENSPDRAFT_682775 [Peniophora sp. CONT]